jgi:hypothetical protein
MAELTKNEQAIAMGYSRYRVNGMEYPNYTTANRVCTQLAMLNDVDVIFECYHENSQHWACFFFKQINNPDRYGFGGKMNMDAEL